MKIILIIGLLLPLTTIAQDNANAKPDGVSQYPNAKSALKYNGKNNLVKNADKEFESDGSYSEKHSFDRAALEAQCSAKDCVCGVGEKSISKKIDDCKNHKILKKFAKYQTWSLVTRTGPPNGTGVFTLGREVWLDTDTKLLWSSRVAIAVNWCKASGSDANFKDPFKICNNPMYQSLEKPVSACNESKDFQSSPEINSSGKGDIGLQSIPKVEWRLPTLNDYYRALANGILHVVPDSKGAGTWEWSSTVFSPNNSLAWDVSTQLGEVGNDDRRGTNAARCIANITL